MSDHSLGQNEDLRKYSVEELLRRFESIPHRFAELIRGKNENIYPPFRRCKEVLADMEGRISPSRSRIGDDEKRSCGRARCAFHDAYSNFTSSKHPPRSCDS
jgi:hypothetical protein